MTDNVDLRARRGSLRRVAVHLPPDRGFDTVYPPGVLDAFEREMTDDTGLAALVEAMHEAESACDFKRGEYYPELLRASLTLRQIVAEHVGIESERVHVNFGSNGAIDTIFVAAKLVELREMSEWQSQHLRALTGDDQMSKRERGRIIDELSSTHPATGVLATSPTYFRIYNSASSRQLRLHLTPLRDGMHFDSERFISAMQTERPRVAVLISPNNPTGECIDDAALIQVLDNVPAGTWVMLDRTLVNIRPEISTSTLLARYAHINLVILHSFSKYHGMSHLRIGVSLYSNSEFAQMVEPLLPLGISLEGCVKAARVITRMGGIKASEKIISLISESRATLSRFVTGCDGFTMSDCAGNYALLELPKHLSSAPVADELAADGLFVMPGHELPEPNPRVLRIHMGVKASMMERLCEKLGRIAEPREGSQVIRPGARR